MEARRDMIFMTGGAYQGKLDIALSLFEGKRTFIVEADSLPPAWFSDKLDEQFFSIDKQLEDDRRFLDRMPDTTLNRDSEDAKGDVVVVNHVERIAKILHERHVSPEDAVNNLLLNLADYFSQDCQLIFIADEVGAGIVPLGKDARAERELAGRLATLLASKATQVIRVLAGIPMVIKS